MDSVVISRQESLSIRRYPFNFLLRLFIAQHEFGSRSLIYEHYPLIIFIVLCDFPVSDLQLLLFGLQQLLLLLFKLLLLEVLLKRFDRCVVNILSEQTATQVLLLDLFQVGALRRFGLPKKFTNESENGKHLLFDQLFGQLVFLGMHGFRSIAIILVIFKTEFVQLRCIKVV